MLHCHFISLMLWSHGYDTTFGNVESIPTDRERRHHKVTHFEALNTVAYFHYISTEFVAHCSASFTSLIPTKDMEVAGTYQQDRDSALAVALPHLPQSAVYRIRTTISLAFSICGIGRFSTATSRGP